MQAFITVSPVAHSVTKLPIDNRTSTCIRFPTRKPLHHSVCMSVAVRGSSKNPYRIAVLPGDGAGPAVANAVKKVLGALAADADLHFEFTDAPYGNDALKSTGSLVPESTVEICRSADAILRSYQGTARGDGPSTSAHIQLCDKLDLFAQFRPVIVYPQLKHLSTLRPEIVSDMDIMLVREISAGALGPKVLSSMEENKSTMQYSKKEVNAIAKVAVEVAMQRSGRILNVDKADVLNVSRFWRYHLHQTVREENAKENDRFVLTNMFADDFVREVIHRPTDFDVVVTSNLFGDICAEVLDALAGPQRMSPSFWKSHDGLGVYGPADIYNLSAYPTAEPMDGPNAIAMMRAASMMLRYQLDEPAAANIIQQALRKSMTDMAEDASKDIPIRLDQDSGPLFNNNGNGQSVSTLVSAFSKTTADEYADVIVRSMELLRQFEQVCDPSECGE